MYILRSYKYLNISKLCSMSLLPEIFYHYPDIMVKGNYKIIIIWLKNMKVTIAMFIYFIIIFFDTLS